VIYCLFLRAGLRHQTMRSPLFFMSDTLLDIARRYAKAHADRSVTRTPNPGLNDILAGGFPLPLSPVELTLRSGTDNNLADVHIGRLLDGEHDRTSDRVR
jgi:hypothetical protein